MKQVRYALLTTITFLVFFVVAFQQQLTNVVASSLTPLQIAEYINHERLAKDIPPLALNPQLSQAAYLKGKDMLDKNYWAHFGPHNETPWQFILKSGYDYVYAGENLAKGFSSAYDIVSAWMASPKHRENVLEPEFKDIGVAVLRGNLRGEYVYLIVALFGATIADRPLQRKAIPALAIIFPEDGAILKEGIVNIRAKGVNLNPKFVHLYVDKVFIKKLQPLKKEEFVSELSLPSGTHTIAIRATGQRHEPLLDFVKVAVANAAKVEKQKDYYKSGISVSLKDNLLKLDTPNVLSFKTLYMRVDNVIYKIARFPYTVELPYVPQKDLSLHFVVETASGTQLEFDKVVSVDRSSVLAGRIGFINLSGPYKTVFVGLSAMFFLLSFVALIIALKGSHYLIWDVLAADLLYILVLVLLNVGFVTV